MDATPALTPDRVLRRLEWHVIRRLDYGIRGMQNVSAANVYLVG